MSINELVKNLTPDVFDNLRTAVELGKWPDGKPLTDEQKQNTLKLVMAYQSKVLKSTEHFTVGADGQIVNRKKSDLQNQYKEKTDDAEGIARFKHDDI
jgi:uncharacterized protein YeaC (DUF1315 family)